MTISLQNFIFIPLLVFSVYLVNAQEPTLHIMRPNSDTVYTTQSRNFVSGNTCPSCQLIIDKTPVKVWPTGAFAHPLELEPGDTSILIQSTDSRGQTTEKSIHYRITTPEPLSEEKEFRFSDVKLLPDGENWLLPGEQIEIHIKAQPGNEIRINNRYPAHELPKEETNGIGGIYRFIHTLTQDDPMMQEPFLLTMKNAENEIISHQFDHQITVLDPTTPLIGRSTDTLPFLEYGQGTDRLGGAKINYIDTAVLLHITGKYNNRYRVQLADGYTAFIPDYQVDLLSKGHSIPRSLTGSWGVRGDDRYDYVSIGLSQKLPYTTFQEIDPARIIVDIYGATANTNWITQLKTAKEIQSVDYKKIADDVLRVTISLKHQVHWGYSVYYQGNHLTIRVKRQPEKLRLSKMVVAVDAGHGGAHPGARGATGAMEKTITLEIAQKLKKSLTRAGAKVIMTRNEDQTLSMHDRLLYLQKEEPDMLISIHCNSASNPVDIKGTSTYYRYIGFRPLSQTILDRMLDLGFHNFGNIGRFNFSLNGPTEYPNVLVETLFISHPEDEMKLLSPKYQDKMVKAIKRGVKDFLKQTKRKG